MKAKIFPSALILAVLLFSVNYTSCTQVTGKPDSNINGVQIGVISYSWRSMPVAATDILQYCIETGISSIELMGDAAESYAGMPMPAPGTDIREQQLSWRLSASMSKFEELRNMFNDAGVSIHLVKFAPQNWSDGEIDYAFRAAKALGAEGITDEIGEKSCSRLGEFAEKHNMYAVFHNHGQPGEPDFSFDKYLSYSPNNMLNLDVGHYFGATAKHPGILIERLHKRIYSIHLKDKTSKDAEPPNTNRPWGEGDTPLNDILDLIRDNNWNIHCDIELEYEVPAESDALNETRTCLECCRKALAD